MLNTRPILFEGVSEWDCLTTAALIERMAPEHTHKPLVLDYLRNGPPGRYEVRSLCRALARTYKPFRYIEVGVWRGWSMANILDAYPYCSAVGIDLWLPGYANADQNRESTEADIRRAIPVNAYLRLVDGNSHALLPELMQELHPQMVLVDGDHSSDGALADLLAVMPHMPIDGVVVFDDVIDSSDGGSVPLSIIWSDMQQRFPNYRYVTGGGLVPVGYAVRLS